MEGQYHSSWNPIFEPLFEEEYMKRLSIFLENERNLGIVFPPKKLVFNAFLKTSFSEVKVVILGQDPYHDHGQAHGLAFSVPQGCKFPPSLKNIFKELTADIPDFHYPLSGDLSKWAEQGVLLLNATLTVRAHQAGSHQNQGWESFTDAIIQAISDRLENVVFVLWGNHAQKKQSIIDEQKHLVLKSAHPSPLSCYRGFFGCSHFSTINKYFASVGKKAIDWTL
ncbi:uracil-DNA glycosylase [Sphingobacterium shayense]|uniref:uracil-DNA glycosylase n=1 Tax=Sphingobacterium shayense TaxID=626343 RepID=UPI0015537C0F|nr:uracil-DNA glycosylase [Sphingobacterium shayense]NQD72636.1 uracil-DNA glycosylase [Sphingobacterium shayense]